MRISKHGYETFFYNWSMKVTLLEIIICNNDFCNNFVYDYETKYDMPAKNQILSPLRYPGSKRALVGYIKDTFALNSLRPSLFVEPFAGGASIGINLLYSDLIDNLILIDIDPWITSFWQTVFFDSDWITTQISSLDVTIENWHKFKNTNPKTKRDQALTCLFLNRTNFSGILENRVGPLGGRKQESKYLIDCRFTLKTRETIIERIQELAKFQNRVYGVWNCSWKEAFQKICEYQTLGKLPKDNLFYYLDPPFFEEAAALYRFYFLEKDHVELRDHLLSLKDNWLLSYDAAERFYELYGDALSNHTNGTHHHNVDLVYSIAKISNRKNAKEVLVSNLDKLPEPPVKNGVHKENV